MREYVHLKILWNLRIINVLLLSLFIRNAVMERRMCTAEKKVNISCNPPPKDGVHSSS